MKPADEAQAEARQFTSPMSALSLFMADKEKREGDPIVFLIHFATERRVTAVG